jgi:hypothetical protein
MKVTSKLVSSIHEGQKFINGLDKAVVIDAAQCEPEDLDMFLSGVSGKTVVIKRLLCATAEAQALVLPFMVLGCYHTTDRTPMHSYLTIVNDVDLYVLTVLHEEEEQASFYDKVRLEGLSRLKGVLTSLSNP